jgi:hypothetical protein
MAIDSSCLKVIIVSVHMTQSGFRSEWGLCT